MLIIFQKRMFVNNKIQLWIIFLKKEKNVII